jgi:hypothetical protein
LPVSVAPADSTQREALCPRENLLDVFERDRFEPALEHAGADKQRRGPIVLGSVEHVLDDPDPPSVRLDSKALATAQPIGRLLALRRDRPLSRRAAPQPLIPIRANRWDESASSGSFAGSGPAAVLSF